MILYSRLFERVFVLVRTTNGQVHFLRYMTVSENEVWVHLK